MQTDSSASRTCLRSRSAVECTATVLIPSSRQARRMRSAISPRLAMTIFSSMEECVSRWRTLFDDEQRLVELDRLGVFDQDGLDDPILVRFDLVQHLHGFDDAERIANLDPGSDLNEGLGARRRRTVEGADHGGADD